MVFTKVDILRLAWLYYNGALSHNTKADFLYI